MRSLFLLGIYLFFVFAGLRAPFLLVLGYVWVDIFTPQLISYGLLSYVPVSLILGLLTVVSVVMLPRNPDVRLRAVTVLVALFAVWMTTTLAWAVLPEPAMEKWSWAIKSVSFSCLVPFFFRNRVQVEAFIWVIVLSGMGHCIPFAVKVLVSGGGYGRPLGLIAANSGYGESSTLSMFAVSLVPMCMHLRAHSVLFARTRLFKLALLGFAVCGILTSLGTYARTGLISLGVLACALVFFSKHRLIVMVLSVVFALGVGAFMGEGWSGRMSTIADSSGESSAMGRVGVWLWTLDYVAKHPLGGSFEIYRINQIDLELGSGEVLQAAGKAFHSVYFEILGETGVPGFILYLLIVATTLIGLLRIRSRAREPDAQWIRSLCDAVIVAALIFLAGGAFIGVGFSSYFYYLGAASAMLANVFDGYRRQRALDAAGAQAPANAATGRGR